MTWIGQVKKDYWHAQVSALLYNEVDRFDLIFTLFYCVLWILMSWKMMANHLWNALKMESWLQIFVEMFAEGTGSRADESHTYSKTQTVGHRGFTRKKAHTFIKSCQPSTRIIKQHWIYPTISGSNFMALDRKYGHHRMHTYAEIKLLFFTLEGVRLDPRVAPAPVSRVSSCNTCAWN